MIVIGRQGVPMSVKREDFDVPVEDYNFADIQDVPSLIDQMEKAGGFTATKLAHARDVLRDAISKSQDDLKMISP